MQMIYSAVGLAMIGVVAGLAFRWKVLLPLIIFVPVAAIVLSISRSVSYEETAIEIVIAEAILQGSYFAGLLIRFVATAAMRLVGDTAVKSRRDPAAHGNE
jgi:hypothetical protein